MLREWTDVDPRAAAQLKTRGDGADGVTCRRLNCRREERGSEARGALKKKQANVCKALHRFYLNDHDGRPYRLTMPTLYSLFDATCFSYIYSSTCSLATIGSVSIKLAAHWSLYAQ